MIPYDIAKNVLSKIYNYKAPDNASPNNLLKGSLFGMLIPDIAMNYTAINCTKELLKYGKIYRSSIMPHDLYLPEDWYTIIDMNEAINKIENFLKYNCKGLKYIKRGQQHIERCYSETNRKIIYGKTTMKSFSYWKFAHMDCKSAFEFKLRDMWCEIRFNFPQLEFVTYYNDKYKYDYGNGDMDIRRLSRAIISIIRNEYRKKTGISNLMPKKFMSTLKRIESLGKMVDTYKDMRWVILVHGEPGTGKTWLFKNLPIFTDKVRLLETWGLSSSMRDARKKLYESCSDKKQIGDDEIVSPSKSNGKSLSGINELGYDIFDEFDMYVGNYTTERSIETDKSFLVNMFKETLDKTTGLVILITNHKDKIDPSVIRDGRVNEVIDFDKHFYDLDEKKNIVEFYNRQYNIPDFKISNKELNNMLISSIESRCKKEMLDRGFKEID